MCLLRLHSIASSVCCEALSDIIAVTSRGAEEPSAVTLAGGLNSPPLPPPAPNDNPTIFSSKNDPTLPMYFEVYTV